jgi:hypothetical protein
VRLLAVAAVVSAGLVVWAWYELREALQLVSDRDVDEFVAAAMSHRRGPQSVEALLAENERLEEQRDKALVALYRIKPTEAARLCDEELDRSGALLGRLRRLTSAAGDTGAAP